MFIKNGSICVAGIRKVTMRIVHVEIHRWTLGKAWLYTKLQVFLFNGIKVMCFNFNKNISPYVWDVPDAMYWQIPFSRADKEYHTSSYNCRFNSLKNFGNLWLWYQKKGSDIIPSLNLK